MGATEPDPFAIFHTPPPNETAGERATREAKEAEAKKISDQIDEQLKADKLQMKKEKYVVRVLLLGQSESGKSTTLKNFRMRYARAAWDLERASWRSVIQLNVIRTIITIVETIQAEMDGEPLERPQTPTTPMSALPGGGGAFPLPSPAPDTASSDVFHYDPLSRPGESPSVVTSFARSSSLSRQKVPLSSLLTAKHQVLKTRLGPLRRVEKELKKRLGAGAEEEQDGAAEGLGALSIDTGGGIPGSASVAITRAQNREFGVARLQEALEKSVSVSKRQSMSLSNGDGAAAAAVAGEGEETDEATEVLCSCLEDMKALWTDEVVRTVLRKRKIRLEDQAGFFLDDLDRIATRTYEPSDDDVIRARLRTLGVQEYRIRPTDNPAAAAAVSTSNPNNNDAGKDWILYDVGGSRTIRHAWLPYFDNMQAIIFLAPVSCFDERLSEDSRVNRLEDSFLLWRTVCSSKLLSKTTLILFLNKCDLLKRKLKMGVQVKKYLPSYGDRPNDATTVVKYLREKFKEVLRENSPEQRQSYFYATSVVDTKATAATIKAVKDSILRDYLKSADFV
ncbi:hypothetical protein D9613_008941 [Agrocybe pediades]|uniref:G-alpha-domain-containing protein n=1 Tax=Agrocybe pediades TaxID=84607 RepID=A0A8H4VNK7_9AGAR|nr:hypothetical protein D9613_008941 [Agrocybe pediades]